MNTFLISIALMCSGLFVGKHLCLGISRFVENDNTAKVLAYVLIPISAVMIVVLALPNMTINYSYFFIGLPIYPVNYRRLYMTRET